MKCAPSFAAVAWLFLAACEIPAQGIANANPGVRGNNISWGGSRSSRPRVVFFTSYSTGPYGYGIGPVGYGAVTILQPYVPPASIVIVLPRERTARTEVNEDEPRPGVIRIRSRREREREREREEAKREEQGAIEPAWQPEQIPFPRLPPPMPPAPREPPVPPHIEPKRDPQEESARQVAVGKEAFAAGEYGRAAFRFRKAAEVAPQQAQPHFLLAQALLALGKYRDAVGAIHAGLALDPTWPATGPSARALYGPNAAEFEDHLQELQASLTHHPDDPVLLFLLGYFLWFDGQQDAARQLFEKAAPLVPDRRDVDRFLQAK